MSLALPRWLLSPLAITAALGLAAVPSAHAQSTGTIRGRVVETGSQRPLTAVQVVVGGTTQGAVTGADGEYVITAVRAGEQSITARRIGYTPVTRTVTVPAGGEVRLDVTLAATATRLDQIVVTGTGVATEKRQLGNSITTLDVAALTEKASVLNVAEVLQSKSPGVTLLPGSGTPGTAGEIRIRGTSSLSGYKPVVYIDGIRYNIDEIGSWPATGNGTAGLAQNTQVTSALNFINPNDIESIEIIKGPAAATLYGAEAANGVIQIITKKGTRGQQALQWRAQYERGQTELALDTPTNYTTCTQARIDLRDALGQPAWPGCQGVPVNAILTDNPIQRDPNALRTGDLERLSLSLRGGGDRYSFYVAGDRDSDEGVFFNSVSKRNSVRGNFSFTPNEIASFTTTVSYLRADLRLPIGDESPAGILLSGVRGQPGFLRPETVGPGWSTINPARSNLYNNRTQSDRVTLGATVNVEPFSWFTNRLTLGLDYTDGTASLLFLPDENDQTPEGAVLQRRPNTRIYTIDYAGNLLFSPTSSLTSTTTFGTQIIANRTETLEARGTGLGAPTVTIIGSATTTSGANSFSENNSVGLFVQEQLGWNDRLFLTGALRADDNSSFGANFDAILYPKLSLAWVLSEEPALQRLTEAARLTTFKLRGAWGQAGRAPAPYSSVQTYSISVATLGATTASALRTSSYGNPDLKPEKGEEFEIGFDAGLFDDRVGIDLTYYDKSTRDMLVGVPVAHSLGFPVSRLDNLGEVRNRGLELLLTGTPVQLPNFGWDVSVNFATNDNELVDFGVAGKTRESAGTQAYGAVQEHREGYPLGGYWAQLPKRNPDGTPLLSATGAVVLDTAVYLGSSVPTREIGVSNTFTFLRDFRLYALFDYKGGHKLFNLKERNRCQSGGAENCWRTNDPRARFPVTGADSLLAAEIPVWRTVPGAYVEDASFVKLREVSLTYTIPQALVARTGASSASLSLSGRNLALWSDYSGIDPEVNSYGGRNFLRVDAYATPMTRRFSASVNLSF